MARFRLRVPRPTAAEHIAKQKIDLHPNSQTLVFLFNSVRNGQNKGLVACASAEPCDNLVSMPLWRYGVY